MSVISRRSVSRWGTCCRRTTSDDAVRATLLPRIPPHVGIPAAFVLLDKIKIRDQRAIIHEAVFLDRFGNVFVGLVVAPAALAHEAVVNEDFLCGKAAAVGLAPFEHV